MNKKIKLIENIFYYIGLALGLYILAKTMYLRYTLPPGSCPLTNTRSITFLALGFLVSSLLLSFISKSKNK